MPKYHKIVWRKSDLAELSKTVRSFNAKITRLAKKNPSLANVLPEKQSMKLLKELINTRRDFIRELNSLKRFMKPGAEEVVEVKESEYNLKVTKWQKAELNRRIAIVNRRRKQRLEEISQIELKSRGESLGYTQAQIGMGKITEISLSPMRAFTRSMSQRDLKKKWLGVLRESQSDFFTQRDFQLRENYIQALEQNFNVEDIKDVIKEIQNIDIKEFLQKFEEEGGAFEIVYPPNREQYESYVKAIKTIWNPEK